MRKLTRKQALDANNVSGHLSTMSRDITRWQVQDSNLRPLGYEPTGDGLTSSPWSLTGRSEPTTPSMRSRCVPHHHRRCAVFRSQIRSQAAHIHAHGSGAFLFGARRQECRFRSDAIVAPGGYFNTHCLTRRGNPRLLFDSGRTSHTARALDTARQAMVPAERRRNYENQQSANQHHRSSA